MSQDKYENSGFLYPKQPSGKGPTASGNVKFGRELLRWMFEEAKAGREVVVELAAWDKTSKSGSPYQSLLASKPWVKEEPRTATRTAPVRTRQQEPEDDGGDVPF
jgi:hypothetical protein